MSQLKNKTYLIKYRKNLREKVTPAEAVLWKYIKSEKLEGIKFRRQYSVNNYILDFYCPKFKLAIELDVHIISAKKELSMILIEMNI